MNMTISKTILGIVAMLTLCLPMSVMGTMLPFSEDFDDDIGTPPSEQGENWTESTGTDNSAGSASWSLVDSGGGDDVYRASLGWDYSVNATYGVASATSSASISDVAGSDFKITHTFSLNSFDGSAENDRLRLSTRFLGDNSDLTGKGINLTYFAAFEGNSNDGKLRFNSNDGSSADVGTPSAGTLARSIGTTYTITITGTYTTPGDLSTLTLDGSLTDGSDTITASFSDADGTEFSGSYFGFLNQVDVPSTRADDTDTAITVDIDHETLVVIPEPSTLALIGLAFVGACFFRRLRGNRFSAGAGTRPMGRA
jgi:hypothetical protein